MNSQTYVRKQLIIYIHSKEQEDKAFQLLKELNLTCWRFEEIEERKR